MANIITLSRIILAFIAMFLLMLNTKNSYLAAFVVTAVVIWFDGLDGYVARKFNEVSKFGAVLDILGDRVVECTFWIYFMSLGWIPAWIPIVVTARGIITDGLRSVALEQGFTAFGSSTMMQSKIGKFIVASNFCRFTYAVTKAIAFTFLILANTPFEYANKDVVTTIAYVCTYVAVAFCVIRGIPVIIESKRFFPKNAK